MAKQKVWYKHIKPGDVILVDFKPGCSWGFHEGLHEVIVDITNKNGAIIGGTWNCPDLEEPAHIYMAFSYEDSYSKYNIIRKIKKES